jgi:predicted nuclease of restriction endonuclease-like (RecB) superfamily
VTDSALMLPDDYPRFLEQLKAQVSRARIRASRNVNTELLLLYWDLGRAILDRQQAQRWGTKVIDQLAQDLRTAFPDMRGLSRRNLFYMRSFAAAWADEIVQQPVARLPWGHVTVLLDKLDSQPHREWYAAKAAEHGWSATSWPTRSPDDYTSGSRPHRRTSLTTCLPRTRIWPNSWSATRTSSTSWA